jgi:hypothetical protein
MFNFKNSQDKNDNNIYDNPYNSDMPFKNPVNFCDVFAVEK